MCMNCLKVKPANSTNCPKMAPKMPQSPKCLLDCLPERCSNHKECGPQEECIETLARGFNARSPEWSSRCMQIPFRRCIQVSTGWGVHLFRRFCKMFSESSPGCWAVLQLSCCPSKQGNFQKTYYKTFGTSCRPRLYIT